MDPILSGVKRARGRLIAQVLIGAATRGALIGAILALIYVVIDRLVFVGVSPLIAVASLMGGPVLICLFLAMFKLPDRAASAVALDVQFDLKERVATAISLEGENTAVAEAVREDARSRIRALDLDTGLPVRFPRELGWMAAILLLLALLAGALPYVDVFARAEARDRIVSEKREVKLQAKSLLEKRKKLVKKLGDKKLKDVKKVLKEWERVALDLANNPGSRKKALVKLSKLTDSIREKKNQSRFKSLGRIAKALSKHAGSLPFTKELRSALRKGDMKSALKALAALKEKLKNGDLSAEMKEQLKKELKSLSIDLAAAPKLSNSFDSAANDIADDDLQSALEGLEDAEMSLEEMADSLEEFALLEEALAGLEDQRMDPFLDEEDLAALEIEICEDCGGDLEEAWKALGLEDFGLKAAGDGECKDCGGKGGDCKSCGGSGKAKAHAGKAGGKGAGKGKGSAKRGKVVCRRCLLGGGRGHGPGMGGPGRGRGGQAPEEPDSWVKYKKVKIKGKVGRGKIIGEILVDGPQAKGEISEEYIEIVGEARQEAADALSKQRIPQGYRDFIREYFNSLDSGGDE
ncbi:MAG: hypothetical protein O7H41_02610 [Planctomycetota bacterium]|nr:hypothetical protein [Planctomycetota bacterium]